MALLYPRRTVGREHVPKDGALLICSNHSHALDPFILAYSIGWRNQIYIMAKVELFRFPVLGALLRALEVFPVERGTGGVSALKGAIRFLRAEKKVLMFPEGTRVKDETNTNAKTGAVRIAVQTGAPILPIYIPRRKRLFRFNRVVIGKPYTIDLDKKTANQTDYEQLTIEMMQTINQLGKSTRKHKR